MSVKARSIGAIWNQSQWSPRKMSVPLRQVRADSERYHTKRPSAVLATPIRPTLGKSVLPVSRGYPPAVELKKAFYARSSCYRGQSQLRRKPECSYNTLITMALLTSEEETLPVRKIYKYLEQEFEYFKTCAPGGWKSSIRHCLSLGQYFRKVNSMGSFKKGACWEMIHEKKRILKKSVEKFIKEECRRLFANANNEPLSPVSSGDVTPTSVFEPILSSRCIQVGDPGPQSPLFHPGRISSSPSWYNYSYNCDDVATSRSSLERSAIPLKGAVGRDYHILYNEEEVRASDPPVVDSKPSLSTASSCNNNFYGWDATITAGQNLVPPKVPSPFTTLGSVPSTAPAAPQETFASTLASSAIQHCPAKWQLYHEQQTAPFTWNLDSCAAETISKTASYYNGAQFSYGNHCQFVQPQVNPGYCSWPNSTGYSQCVRDAPSPGDCIDIDELLEKVEQFETNRAIANSVPGSYYASQPTAEGYTYHNEQLSGKSTTTHKKSRKRPLDTEEIESSIEPLRKRPALTRCTSLSTWDEEENSTVVDEFGTLSPILNMLDVSGQTQLLMCEANPEFKALLDSSEEFFRALWTEVDFAVPLSPKCTHGRFTKEMAWKSVTQREDKQF